MHPFVALKRLTDQEKDIVGLLSRSGKPMSQVALREKMRDAPSQPVVSRIVSRLAAQGIIEKLGETRGARFALTAAAAWFSVPPQLRPRVDYDPSRIGDYVPNQTRWLPDAALARFEAAASGVAHQLDASTYSRQIAERFLIDLTWASSMLEGNTYNYLDTEVLVKYGEAATGHELVETTMILNHKNVIATLLENVGKAQLLPRYAARVHAMLMRDLIAPEDLGRVRANDERITSSSYRPSADCDQLSADLGLLLWKAEQTTHPFEASFLLLVGLSYLQAFADGNKRMGRIFSNVPLLAQGKPPLSFIGIDRSSYLSGLVAFYEVADVSLLAEAVAKAYEQAASSYAASLATHRVPRSVELRERKRISEEIQVLIMRGIPHDEAETSIRKRFADLSADDQGLLVASITNILRHITPENAAAWGVDAEIAEEYRGRV